MLYIGLMSGTSLDGVDASLIDTDSIDYFRQIANLYLPYPRELTLMLKNLISTRNLDLADLLNIEKLVTNFHVTASRNLLHNMELDGSKIRAIGFHGITLLHNPAEKLSIQIGNPHYLAQEMGISVVYDFRRRDIMLGGQGAPLVPIFHKLIMKGEEKPIAVVNIGGVANITYIGHNGDLISFDTGPGNAMINDIVYKYLGKDFDNFGIIAESGNINYSIINEMICDSYFTAKYPKSLDRNQFSFIFEKISHFSIENQVATLTFLTIFAIYKAVILLPNIPKKIYLSGGGVKNNTMIKWFRNIMLENNIDCEIDLISNKDNLNPDFIESQAFAYLAARHCFGLPGAFPSTTGASRENICGCMVNV